MDDQREEKTKEAEETQLPPPQNVPPPPPEVKIRTLQSDLESLVKSGGASPQFKTVKAPGLAAVLSEIKKKPELKRKTKNLWLGIVVLLVILVVVVVYLAYQVFVKNSFFTSLFWGPEATSSQAAPSGQPAIITEFKHKSFLRKGIDETLTLVIGAPAESASELQTYGQKLSGLLAQAKASSTFLEIVVNNNIGEPFTVSDFLQLINADILNPQFILSNFDSDFTMFVYRNKNGNWPGYILNLKSGQNWLFLKSDIASLEKSPKIINLFSNSPGDSTGEGFRDIMINSQPARILNFSSGASFVYGWFRGYLILSTSEDGLKEALSRL